MTARWALVTGVIVQSIACARPHASGINDQPAVEVIHHSRTYEVNPLNPNDLRRSISDQWRCGGFECKIGETQSNTTFTYDSAKTSSGVCSIKSVHVRVETAITIPHWEPQGVTSAARRNWWANIQASVTRHEHQHVFNAEDGGKAIAAALMELTAPDCRTLARLASRAVRDELLRIEQLQRDFDRSEGPLQITAPPP